MSEVRLPVAFATVRYTTFAMPSSAHWRLECLGASPCLHRREEVKVLWSRTEVAHLLGASRACAEGTQDLEVEVRLQWLAVDAPDVSGMTDDELRDAYWQRLATGEGFKFEEHTFE
jgi:hypothetical protein